ncbi:conserved hypothetical protein [Paraburkholderia ribeironis]|uniref:Uncharacterized protein n=1 Tax=Paraburkholderia ribeironis TaxID=1247936 RepID=A0A1N7S844_9BURK|nr:CCE_0567 family metalloprotein [Paraburkholderia ribeironis]SIT43598.1 conserved hypothetical protein [Paraburkholderia ribeironis]
MAKAVVDKIAALADSDARGAAFDREDMMNDSQELKARLKKLNTRAIQTKMDLHDLSEELPTNWERILIVAQRCHDAHAALMDARKAAAAASW